MRANGQTGWKAALWSENRYISRVVVIPPFAESKCRKIVSASCSLFDLGSSIGDVVLLPGAERYEDRGIIPRTIAYVFEAML